MSDAATSGASCAETISRLNGAPSSSTTTAGPPAPLLVVTAIRGSTHATARRNTANGTIVYDGTVSKGDPTAGIRGSKLWVSISSPENLRIEVRGHLVHVPGARPQVIFITPTGWRPAS